MTTLLWMRKLVGNVKSFTFEVAIAIAKWNDFDITDPHMATLCHHSAMNGSECATASTFGNV